MSNEATPIKEWSVADVGKFLERNGLSQLVEVFQFNSVSGKELVDLSEEDLTLYLGCTQLQARKITRIIQRNSSTSGSNEQKMEMQLSTGIPSAATPVRAGPDNSQNAPYYPPTMPAASAEEMKMSRDPNTATGVPVTSTVGTSSVVVVQNHSDDGVRFQLLMLILGFCCSCTWCIAACARCSDNRDLYDPMKDRVVNTINIILAILATMATIAFVPQQYQNVNAFL